MVSTRSKAGCRRSCSQANKHAEVASGLSVGVTASTFWSACLPS